MIPKNPEVLAYDGRANARAVFEVRGSKNENESENEAGEASVRTEDHGHADGDPTSQGGLGEAGR